MNNMQNIHHRHQHLRQRRGGVNDGVVDHPDLIKRQRTAITPIVVGATDNTNTAVITPTASSPPVVVSPTTSPSPTIQTTPTTSATPTTRTSERTSTPILRPSTVSTPSVSTTLIVATSTSTRLPSTTSSSTSIIPPTSSTPVQIITTPTTPSILTTPTRGLVTQFVTASVSLSSAGALASSAADGSSASSDGPSAGTVVGIVAGALVGVVVLSGIIGYFFRTKCRTDKDDDANDYDGTNPFGSIDNAYGSSASRGDLRRESQMLADEDDAASAHQMSELGHGGDRMYANAAPAMMGAGAGAGVGAVGAYGLNRAPTSGSSSLPGLARSDTVNPRPPTMIQRHFAHQQQQQQYMNQPPMPSFQPGQIVSQPSYFPGGQSNQSGPYPSFAAGAGVPPSNNGYSSSSYPDAVMQQYGSNYRSISPEQSMHPGYASDRYQQSGNGGHSAPAELPQRSGTPEFTNPQQYFHAVNDSYSASAQNSPARLGGNGNGHSALPSIDVDGQGPFADYNQQYQGQSQYPSRGQLADDREQDDVIDAYRGVPAPSQQYNQQYSNQLRSGPTMNPAERGKRTLSVRNGHPDSDTVRESIYGGM